MKRMMMKTMKRMVKRTMTLRDDDDNSIMRKAKREVMTKRMMKRIMIERTIKRMANTK